MLSTFRINQGLVGQRHHENRSPVKHKKKERKAIGNTITATEGSKQELSLGVESAGHRVYCKPKLPFTSSPTIKQITNL